MEKHLDQFPKDYRNKSGIAARCCACTSVAKREWYLANKETVKTKSTQYYWQHRERKLAMSGAYQREHPEQRKRYTQVHRVKSFGITEKEYQALVARQDAKCAICGRERGVKDLHIDHDHKTGKVRGLLCQKCNQMLGFGDDDPERFRQAVVYLT